MKKQNLYNVTVVGSFSKDILIWAEDEDTALDFAQSICDNTDLICFEGDESLEFTAEDVEEIYPFDSFEIGDSGDSGGSDGDTENCGKCEKRGTPTIFPSSVGEEAEALRKLTELLGGPFVGILID